jgi:hypothetical protein
VRWPRLAPCGWKRHWVGSGRLLRLLVAQVAEIALGHVPRRLGNALLLDGFRCFLAGLFDLADDLRRGFFPKALAGRVAVELLAALGVEIALLLGGERVGGGLVSQGPAAGSRVGTTLRKILVPRRTKLVPNAGALSAGVLGILKLLQLLAEVL